MKEHAKLHTCIKMTVNLELWTSTYTTTELVNLNKHNIYIKYRFSAINPHQDLYRHSSWATENSVLSSVCHLSTPYILSPCAPYPSSSWRLLMRLITTGAVYSEAAYSTLLLRDPSRPGFTSSLSNNCEKAIIPEWQALKGPWLICSISLACHTQISVICLQPWHGGNKSFRKWNWTVLHFRLLRDGGYNSMRLTGAEAALRKLDRSENREENEGGYCVIFCSDNKFLMLPLHVWGEEEKILYMERWKDDIVNREDF